MNVASDLPVQTAVKNHHWDSLPSHHGCSPNVTQIKSHPADTPGPDATGCKTHPLPPENSMKQTLTTGFHSCCCVENMQERLISGITQQAPGCPMCVCVLMRVCVWVCVNAAAAQTVPVVKQELSVMEIWPGVRFAIDLS